VIVCKYANEAAILHRVSDLIACSLRDLMHIFLVLKDRADKYYLRDLSKVAIQQAVDNGYKVACATPTGFLRRTYRAEFIEDNFEADTIHSMFRYPVNSTERAADKLECRSIRLANSRRTIDGSQENIFTPR